jgi:TusE/DsrC/DsvC family sulfur relay protein
MTGIRVDRDAGGFLVDPEQWTEAEAEEIARESGIEELTARHWLVINSIRDADLRRHAAQSIRVLTKVSNQCVTMCPLCLVNLTKAADGQIAFRDISEVLLDARGRNHGALDQT